MGTRATVVFKENGVNVAAIYKQYDGYIDGLGHQLAEIINGGEIGNGISGFPQMGDYFNGAGCLFATIIAKLKTNVGSVYMIDPSTAGDQDYNYVVEVNNNVVTLKVFKYEDESPIILK